MCSNDRVLPDSTRSFIAAGADVAPGWYCLKLTVDWSLVRSVSDVRLE